MVEQESFRIRTIREEAEKIEYREKRNWSEEQFNAFLRTIDTYLNSKVINKEMLMELRNYFNLSTDCWLFITGVNCYAYALGCDLPERRIYGQAYNPGSFYGAINQTKFDILNSNTLIERMEMDFETLNLDYRVVEPDEAISEDEWKIAFFKDKTFVRGNFHFLRQGKDGLWYHKPGFLGRDIPTSKDHNGNIITNPVDAFFSIPKRNEKMYEYERCYSLKMR